MKRGVWVLFFCLLLLAAGCGKTESQGPISLIGTSDGYSAALAIAPGSVGPNTFTVTLKDQQHQTVTGGRATLYFAMAGMEHGKSELALASQPDGTWKGEGPHLMMGGKWQLRLVWADEQGKSRSFAYEIDLAQ
ncbi:hypothetical protein G3578_12570 [Brevibacillus sp. SYP-B805]|uniref:FixH family protein n=1 Tax=Brevibacillus sp. SYP-B805 TaxID=1578199 RepID=UPI0013EE1190|nr:FixH family protein [Brevibacillus sp. SYP-B805]NGQ95991.1 hypothetical protein [Brevibacillus sp. SYP-B805]